MVEGTMKEIKFKRDTSFREQFFVPDSFAHPAKMDSQLLIWIVENFTKEGDVILDPMAGSGTLMLACTLGRHCVLVEIEEKFCKMMRDNWEQVRMRPQLGSNMGDTKIICGDARALDMLIPNADSIISSPPYALTVQKGHEGVQAWKVIEGLKNADSKTLRKRSKELAEQGIISNQYGDNPSNIGNLKYGQIDSVITSPPYEGSVNVPDSKQDARAERLKKAGYDPKDYMGGHGRNLQQDWSYKPVDHIVTSPPYEGAIANREGDKTLEKFAEGYTKGSCITQSKYGYSNNNSNIGNLKSASYLSAMKLVYAQCYSVLRPGGLLILITKNFIRDKKLVRLDRDTIKLCRQCGFVFKDLYRRKLPAQSFWRVIYKQKYPDAPEILFEDILIFSKEL